MRGVSILAALVCCALPVGASQGAGAGAASAPDLRPVESGLARLADGSGGFAGTVLVAKDGKPVFARAYGAARMHPRVPNRVDTKFNLASMGKMFTGVAIAQLVQAGKLRFTDKVGRYVPELPRSIGTAVTIAELLDHTSGLGDFFQHPGYLRVQPRLTSLRAYLPLIVDQPPAFSPGSRFSYSNSGYIILGLVVERVSGEDYYGYLERHIFRPTGMSSTGCPLKSTRDAKRSIGYIGPLLLPNTSQLPPRGTSAGGCYSTAGDLLQFANALFGHRLLGATLTQTVTTSKSDSYGYGFAIRRGRPGDPPTVWHNGGFPGVGTESDMNPSLGYTVVVLGNRDPEHVTPAIDLILNTLRIP